MNSIVLIGFAVTHSAKLRPEDVLKTSLKNVLTSPYGPMCNTKGRICSGTSLERTQDVNLTIIHKIEFLRIFFYFSWFRLYIRHFTAKISEKPDTFYFGPIMVRDVSTKIGPLGDVPRSLRAGSEGRKFGYSKSTLPNEH